MPTVLAMGWDPPEGERNAAEPGSGLSGRSAPVTSPCTSAPAHAKRRGRQRVGPHPDTRPLRSGVRNGRGRDSPMSTCRRPSRSESAPRPRDRCGWAAPAGHPRAAGAPAPPAGGGGRPDRDRVEGARSSRPRLPSAATTSTSTPRRSSRWAAWLASSGMRSTLITRAPHAAITAALVSTSGADVERDLTGPQLQRLDDDRHHQRLGDGLPGTDGESPVGVRLLAVTREDVLLPGHGRHRCEHGLVPDPAGAEPLEHLRGRVHALVVPLGGDPLPRCRVRGR